MEKGSMIKIIISLAIISLYVFLFGIMQTVESIDVSIEAAAETAQTEVRLAAAPAVTTGVNEEGRAFYTYATELNVANAKKPKLADYSRTETALLILPEETQATTVETTVPPDYVFEKEDLDYTIPVTTTTTAAPETAPPETTAATTTTAAPETTTTTAAPETTTTTAAPEPEDTESPEDDSDIEDFTDEQEVTYVTTEQTAPPETTAETTAATEETTTTTTAATEAPEDELLYTNNEMFTVNAGGTIITDTAVNVVAAAVMAEIGDGFDDEAIKAQAVAAYTYIKYYNMNNQRAYIAKRTPSEKMLNLVRQVIGKAIYYDGTMIQAVYSASTAGRTASSKTVWGVDYPYLQSIDTGFIDKEYDINYGRKPTFTSDEIKEYVRKSTGIILSGDPSEWIKIDSHVDEIFVGQMTIGGQQTFNNGTRDVNITGRVFRETIMDFDIRSSCFDISYDPSTDLFTITTYGYGHCVGLSQHGANILASKFGYTYDQILKFYYQGVEIR